MAAILLGGAAVCHGRVCFNHGGIHDAGLAAAQSAEAAQLLVAPRFHAGLELHLRCRLAVLRRGDHDELFLAGLWCDGASEPKSVALAQKNG